MVNSTCKLLWSFAPVNGSWSYSVQVGCEAGPPGILPVADFTSDSTIVNEGASIQFTDTSTVPVGGPVITSWLWTFTGGTPSTSTAQNPSIVYDTAGNYQVSLQVTNADGSNTKTIPNYITVEVSQLLIWDQTDTEWQLEEELWAAGTTPTVSIANQSFTDQTQPVILGTATPNVNITATLDGVTYNETSDGTGNFSITVVGGLPQALSPGIDYTLLATPRDPQTGLEGTQVSATITSITTITTTTITFDLTTHWSLFWYSNSIQVEQEVTLGNWSPVEYEGNPTWNNGSTDYKTNPYRTGSVQVGYPAVNLMSWQTGDDSGEPQGGTVSRDIILEAGFNYRIVGVPSTVGENFAEYCSYTVYEGATEILPFYRSSTNNAPTEWALGYVQQTFTL